MKLPLIIIGIVLIAVGLVSLAYQGITLSLANYDRLDIRGKICAIQQSSIFIRVSIARLINEVKRVRLFDGFRARFPRLGRLARPAFELCFRRSQICLGHNQFVRLDLMQAVGGFPTAGATEDQALGTGRQDRGAGVDRRAAGQQRDGGGRSPVQAESADLLQGVDVRQPGLLLLLRRERLDQRRRARVEPAAPPGPPAPAAARVRSHICNTDI